MLLSAKLFIASLVISLTTGIAHNFLYTWMHFFYPSFSPTSFAWFSLIFAPVSFVIGIVLPFMVMYLLTVRSVEPLTKLVFIATFVGCWIGEASTLILNVVVTHLLGGSYGYGPLMFGLYLMWGLFAAAFSSTLFISLTAILLAYFRRK